MYDVISIGAATVDIFVRSQSLSLKNDCLTILASSKNEMQDGLICSGGGATNSSVSLSRLGLKTACLSLIGDDPLSVYIFNDLKQDNVSTDLLIDRSQETTDYSVILVGSDGGRSIITNRGTSCLDSPLIDWDNFPIPQWFYITSLEGNIDLLEQLIGFAYEHHIRISLNPGHRELLHPGRLVELLPRVDFLLLNGAESELLTGLAPESSGYWETLLSYGAETVAVTNGRRGATVLNRHNRIFSPIINTSPVDETGAGDSFGSAFVGGIIRGLSPAECLYWAIKNSASVVGSLGAKVGLLTLDKIEK